jgi:hypothetical protein
MTRSILRVATLAATLVAGLSAVSSASATNWQSNASAGGSAFTASDASSIIIRSAQANGFGYRCNSGSISGTLAGPTGPVNTGPWNNVETFTPSFNTCSIAGTPVTISGATGHFDATSYSGGITSGYFRASWTATYVGTCVWPVTIEAPATSDGTSITLSTTQTGTISWGAGPPGCLSFEGATGAGSSNVRLVGYDGTNYVPAVFTYGSFRPSIFY